MRNLTGFINEAEKSKKQKEYQEFFDKKLKKFGVDSPAKLDDADKKKFFNEIDKEWKGEATNERKVEEDKDSEDDEDSEELKDKKEVEDKKAEKDDDKETKEDDEDEEDEEDDDEDEKVDEALDLVLEMKVLPAQFTKRFKGLVNSKDIAGIKDGVKNVFADLAEDGASNEDIRLFIQKYVDTSMDQIEKAIG
jgi:hypothetical protein